MLDVANIRLHEFRLIGMNERIKMRDSTFEQEHSMRQQADLDEKNALSMVSEHLRHFLIVTFVSLFLEI